VETVDAVVLDDKKDISDFY